jgi:hypothetical protein
MTPMFILLPALTFFLVFLSLTGHQSRNAEASQVIIPASLQSAALLGGYMVLSSEFLSLFKALEGSWVIISWLVALIPAGWFGWKCQNLLIGVKCLTIEFKRCDRSRLIPVVILAVILGLLFLVAIIAPPNNNDSLRYHMARVVHWAQNQSLNHYATAYLPQVMHPIGAELMILNARLLWGSDKLANLIQYVSMLGVIIAVVGVSGMLGVRKDGHWLAVAFMVSLPIGILEATSTQNDYVASFWFISLLYFMLASLRQKTNTLTVICIGIALGMGVLTKTTFSFLAVVPVIVYGILRLKRLAVRSAILEFTLIGCMAILLNTGYWVRNYVSFGSIFGQKVFIAAHVNELHGPGQIVSGLVKTATQNYATPDEGLNARLIAWVNTHLADPNGYVFDLEWGWNHEDLAGNPIHFTLILLTGVLLLLFHKKVPDKWVIWYSFVLLGSFVLLATFTRYDLYGVRYQLPFLVASAPVFAAVVGLCRKKWLAPVLVIILLVSAFPWILFNRTRPLIAMRPTPDPYSIPCLAGCTTPSILANPPTEIVFGNLYEYHEGYLAVREELMTSSCQEVGLILDSHDPEYILWWLLDAPQSGIRIETGTSFPELQRYIDPDYQPCAILCTICSQTTNLSGYQLQDRFGGVLQDGVLYGGVLYYTKMAGQP